ncbi:MAG TPA: hypothetical protein VFJ73_01335, partial [Bacillales bacterium]|nr:hypothetical protein [Bacillales bacterium]
QQRGRWHHSRHEDRVRFREGVETALYALYVLNIPAGECVVQRESPRDYRVYRAGTLSSKDPAEGQMAQKCGLRKERPCHFSTTFGADVECLLQHKTTGRWVSASSITAENNAIGYDDAVAVRGNQVIHPILELRPRPGLTAKQLYRHLLRLYWKFEQYLAAHELCAVTKGFGRFQLGGHLHVGCQPLTFQHVRNLDLFLAIPLSLTESADSVERRQRFGRLGSVKPNRYSGFEYRTLSSWYHLIPELLPVLEWFCYIIQHPDHFPTLDLYHDAVRGYYRHETDNLRRVTEEVERICNRSLPAEDAAAFAAPFFRLIKEKAVML